MARQIGPTVEILLRRVRQEGSPFISEDFATTVYSRCEQVINAYTQRVTASTSLSTPKEKLLFQYRIEIPDAIDILNVRESNRRVERCNNLMDLAAYDIDWFRNITGTRFESWCQLGRDILILYPGQAVTSSVDIKYVKLLTLRDDFDLYYNTDSELPDEDIEMALGLAELVLLASFRQTVEIPNNIKDFIETFNVRRNIQ